MNDLEDKRRMKINLEEKKRRDKMKLLFENLKKVLLGDSSVKMSRKKILTEGLARIRFQQKQSKILKNQKKNLIAHNLYLQKRLIELRKSKLYCKIV